MTDAEIREYARNKILDACRQVNLVIHSNKRSVLVLKEEDREIRLRIEITQEGEVFFHFFIVSSIGAATIQYTPQPYVEMAARLMVEEVQRAIEENNEAPTPPVLYSFWDSHITSVAKAITSIIVAEFEESVLFLPLLAEDIVTFLISEDAADRTERQKEQGVEEIILLRGVGKKLRILEMDREQIQSIVAPQYLFCDVYEDQKQVWSKAKQFYKQAKQFNNALDLVKAAYPDLPEDLIERFVSLDNYESAPSSIALDAAARLLNVSSKIASPSSLRRYLRASKVQRKKIADRDAEKALSEFFERENRLRVQVKEIPSQLVSSMKKITRPKLKENSAK